MAADPVLEAAPVSFPNACLHTVFCGQPSTVSLPRLQTRDQHNHVVRGSCTEELSR